MNRVTGLLDRICYHQFYLVTNTDTEYVELESPDEADEISPHGLLATAGQTVQVLTGIAMGVVGLTIELLDGPPSAIDGTKDWQAVSDVSFQAASPDAGVRILMDDVPAPFAAFALPGGPGWYRVRGHAVGRSLDFDLVVSDNPREHHLLQLWCADGPEPARHHRIDNQWEHQGSA